MGIPTHSARGSRIEQLAKIDPDILKTMQMLLASKLPLPRPEPVVPTPAVEEGLMPIAVDLSTPVPAFAPVFEQLPNSPPPHPAPVDRGRFRIAEEPPGTDLHQPWVSDRCVECREAVWTHNAATAAKHETVCETCFYMMVSDYWERQTEQRRQMTYRVVNPFES